MKHNAEPCHIYDTKKNCFPCLTGDFMKQCLIIPGELCLEFEVSDGFIGIWRCFVEILQVSTLKTHVYQIVISIVPSTIKI